MAFDFDDDGRPVNAGPAAGGFDFDEDGNPLRNGNAAKGSNTGDFLRGAKESFQQLPQLGYGILAGVGAAAENVAGEGGIATGIKKAGIAGYKDWGDTIAKGSKESDSWDYSYEQAKQGNFGSLVDWLQHGLGYVGGQAVQTLATGGIGYAGGKFAANTAAKQIAEGMVAKEAAKLTAENAAAKLTTEQIAKQATANVAAKFAAIGQTSALAANAVGMEGGEILGGLTSENADRPLTGAELGKAFVATLAAGGLEFVGDKLGLDIMLGKSALLKPAEKATGILGRAARGGIAAAGAMPIEGGTEFGQTMLEEYGKGKDPFSADAMKQARESAALGALGGMAIGGVGGAIRGPKVDEKKPADTPAAPVLQIGNTPDPLISFPDGTVGRRSEVDAYVNSLPEDQQVAARAKLMGMGARPATPEDILKAPDADSAIAAFTASLTGTDMGSMLGQDNPLVTASRDMQTQAAADELDLADLAQTEARDLNTLRALTLEDMRKQRELDALQATGTGQYGIPIEAKPSVEAAATVEAPTALQLAMQRAREKAQPQPATTVPVIEQSLAAAKQELAAAAPAPIQRQPDILPSDISREDGTPFKSESGAKYKQRFAGGIDGSEIVQVQGGYVIRPKSAPTDPVPAAPGQEAGMQPAASGVPAAVSPAQPINQPLNQENLSAQTPKAQQSPAAGQDPAAGAAPVPASIPDPGQPAEGGAVPAKAQDQRLIPVSKRTPAQPDDLTDDETTAEFERLYQEDVKADIRRRLGMEPAAREGKATTSPFRTFLRKYGISPQHASDITGERGIRANNRLPATFRRNGLALDELALRAVEEGYLTQADLESDADNGGTNKLMEMIQAEIRGERQTSNRDASGNAEDQMERVRQAELEGMANQLGIPYPADIDPMALASMVARVQRALDASREPKGSTKTERVRQNAIAAAQRIEAKRQQFEEDLAAFANADAAEQNALLEMFMDDDGQPVIVRQVDVMAERAWNSLNGQWEDQNGQADTAEDRPAPEAGAPDNQAAGERPGDGNETGAQAQRGDSGGQEEGLTAPTRADVLRQQAQAEAEAARKEQGGDKPIQRKVTADTPDLFNPQGSVFDQPAEPEAPPAAQASQILDAANITGKDRLDILKDVKSGALTPDEVQAAFPGVEPAKKGRLTDAGEELIRNRRGKLKGLAWDDVSAMNDTLKVAQVIKSNVWPRPDYAKMVEDGAPAWKAAALKAVYDKLAAAPVTRAAPTDSDLRAYIETMGQVREALMAELDRVERDGTGDKLWASLQARNVFGKVFPVPADAKPVFGAPSPFDRKSEQGKENNRRALLIGGNAAVQALQFNYKVTSKVKDLLSEGFPKKQEAWQKSYEVRQTDTRDNDVPEGERTGEMQQRFYVYEKGSRWRLAKGVQDGGYATQEQAEAFARTLTTKKRDVLPPSRGLDLADVSRTGPDWRKGKNVTSDQVMEHFGFRGVNLGEYVKAKQDVAQLHLNHAFDAFSDLADLMGVPPKAMSLNGTLGVAIGAQGSGKALAHFVPGVNEINITRDSGAGALAHEFGHAVDHYFATQHGRAASMAKRPYLSAVVESVNDAGGVRPEVMGAMRTVMKAINSRPMTEAEAKKYMADQRALNERRMDRWVAEFKGNRGADPEALAAVAEKLKRGDVGEVRDDDVESNLAEFMRAAGFRPGNSLAAHAFTVAYRLRDLADEARFMASHIPQMETNYSKASAALDAKKTGDGYWSTPWEKFARAFETFVMDALADRQRESLYLSGLVDSKGWQSWSDATGKSIPYPSGDERLVMQQAFQKLVDTIQTKEDDAGNVAMFARGAASDVTQTPEFKAWFKDSKVVNPDGSPMAVYHGTHRDFSAFDAKAPSVHIPLPGFYFTPDPSIASVFAENGAKRTENAAGRPFAPIGANVMPTYLSLQNPLDVDVAAGGMKGFVSEKVIKDVILEAKRLGHDGVILRGWADGSGPVQYIAFRPEQIKSAIGNRGTFDPANPDIRFDRNADLAQLEALLRAVTPRQSQTAAAVREMVSPLSDKWNIPITVVQRPNQLPVPAPSDARGLYHNGQIYLVASNLNSRASVMRTLGHEAIAHHGLREMLGDDGFSSMMRQINLAVKAGNPAMRKISEYVRRTYVDEDGKFELTPEQEADEIAARAVEDGIDPESGEFRPGFGWLKGVFARVAQFLRDLGITVPMSNTELQGVLVNSMRGLEAGAKMRGQQRVAAAARNEAMSRKGDQTDSAEFKAWFGDWTDPKAFSSRAKGPVSYAVDKSGKPLRLYHATNGDFSTFEIGRTTVNSTTFGEDETERHAIFSTPDIKFAEEYLRSKTGANVIPVYASIQAPMDLREGISGYVIADIVANSDLKRSDFYYMTPSQMWQLFDGDFGKKFVAAAKAAGYDGAILTEVDEKREADHEVYAAFDPAQFKSAIGNSGAFDPKNPDIRFARSAVTGKTITPTWQAPDPTRMDDLLYSMQDKHIDTKRVVTAVRDAIGGIADNLDPYLQEELYHGRAAMATKEFLEKSIRPLLTDMQARGVEMSDFEEYLHNRHAERRNDQVAKVNPNMPDGGSGIKTADARAYLSGLSPAKRTAYQALARRVDQMNRDTRALLVSSGLEKQSTIDAWQAAYGDEYVPLMREEMDNGAMGIGQGFSVRGSSSKRAMGSNKPVANILANIALQREKAITRAEKRRIGEALYGMVLSAPNPDFWFAVDPALEQTPAQITATSMQLISMGLNPVDAEAVAREPRQRYIDPRTGQVAERINPVLRSADNVLAVRIDGEDKYVFFNAQDPRAMRMAKALKNLDSDQLGVVMGNVAKVTRYFASINTQFNPVFGVVNLTRDIQTALLNLQSTRLAGKQAEVMKHVGSALRGIYIDLRDHRAGKTPTSTWAGLFEEFQREGGATGYRDMYANAQERADAITDELKKIKQGKAMEIGRGIFGWLSDYNEAMENSVRLAAYKVGKDQGLSNQQAASIAKNISVNFNRKGTVALQGGALYAFLNASIQGTARMAETMFSGGKLSATGKKIMAGGLLLGSMQALLLAAAGYDDEEPPDFVRERSLVLPIGGDKYISIPMPLGFHVIPNLARIPTEWAMGGFRDTPKRLAQLVGLFADAFNPIGSAGLSLQTLAPTIIDPLAALAENRDWTGKQIAKKDFNSMQPTAGHTRAKDTATPWARAIAYGVNWVTGGTDYKPGMASPTPDQIDYLIGQATGGVGREVSKLSQVAGSTVSGEELPLYKIPLLGRFVGTTAGQAAESGRFYENLKEIGEHDAELSGLKKDRRMAEYQVYLRENPQARLVPIADRTYREVSKLIRMKREALKAGASKERVKMLDQQITARMAQFNARVKATETRETATQ